MKKREKICVDFGFACFDSGMTDKVTPIKVKTDFEIEFTNVAKKEGGGGGGGGGAAVVASWPAPILREAQRKMSALEEVEIKKECGKDGICSPGNAYPLSYTVL